MRVCTHLVILVAAITLAATPALANDWSLENFKKGMGKSKWDGCGVGTSFTSWSRTTSPVLVAGHERKTIVKIAGDKTPRTITLKVENKACTPGAPWVAKESHRGPKAAGNVDADVSGQRNRYDWREGTSLQEVHAHDDQGHRRRARHHLGEPNRRRAASVL